MIGIKSSFRLLLLTSGFLVLQSCYTLLYPPETLPQTLTTTVSEQAMASSIGGLGSYGWDPYWEPALPFTSYYQGYGASYYSPYNYYDYYDPYYAPVYIVGETNDPAPARNFDRDEQMGGSRDRDPKGSSVSSASFGGGGGSAGEVSTAAPVISVPPISNPSPVVPAPKLDIIRRRDTDQTVGKTRPVRGSDRTPPKKRKHSSGSDKNSSKKRVRTRK